MARILASVTRCVESRPTRDLPIDSLFRNGVWNSFDYRGYAPPGTFQWGSAGDIPVPADYDGDRQTDYTIFRV